MKKSIRVLALALCIVMAMGGLSSFAAVYSTYTYSIGGKQMLSPDAYAPYKVLTSQALGLPNEKETDKQLSKPTDLFVDDQGYLYIADPENNRIVICDQYYKFVRFVTGFVNGNGVSDWLSGPQGVFVTPSDETGVRKLYVADSGNRRIVVFNYDGEKLTFNNLFEEPDSDVFTGNSSYTPVALAVDSSERIYVVSSSTYEGIMSLNADGSFAAFIGATKVSYNVFQQVWRKFMTAEQRAQMPENVSREYNNIDIDDEGFIYVTTSAIEEKDQQNAITQKDKSGDNAPVKRLNAAGNDIMRRNGFYPPSGEVMVSNALTSTHEGAPVGASTIVDVAIGDEKTWTLLDQKRSRVFTYDKNGNLLFAFGDKGTQMGNLQRAVAVAYQGSAMLILDGETNTITVYHRTEYGDVLINALADTNAREYDKAVEGWRNILMRNNNFDAAYVGIGDALYREGKWEEAMENYKVAYDTDSYSNAFRQYRKDLVADWILLVVAVIVVFFVLLALFFRFAGKVNKRTALKVGKKTFWEEVIYAFHLMLHPFDGFWDLKHEKRGSIRAALFWLLFCILSFSYQGIGKAYLFNPNGGYESVFGQVTAITVPLLLFVTANWCLTTLFDGEGSFKDVFIAACYSTVPLSFLVIISTVLTNFLTTSEGGFVSLTQGLGWTWFLLLLFFGVMVTHDYTLGKNILTVVGSIIGMALIMFLIALFSGLMIKMVSFVSNIITEITYRA